MSEPTLAFGEIRTGLIQNSRALPIRAVEALLRLTPGSPVTSVERPVPRAVSAVRATGVDCRLAVASGPKPRAVGTVHSRAVVTGGRVIQGSSYLNILGSEFSRRRPWAYYLRRPGTIELLAKGSVDADALSDGYLADSAQPQGIDLGSIAQRMIQNVQKHADLDRRTSLRSRPTVLRWAATLQAGSVPSAGITKELSENTHSVRLRGDASDLPTMIRFCEDLALHEWLLTTIKTALSRTELLEPALDQLVHLWMPAVHVSPALLSLWKGLEDKSGYSRQWDRDVARVRDQILLSRPS